MELAVLGSFSFFYQKCIILIIYSQMLLFFEATTDLLVDLLPPPPQHAATSARVRLRKKSNGSWCAPHERICVPCAFALCPGCYVFWYVAKGRGQA